MNVSSVENQLNMEKKSRTEYSARNTTVAMIARVLAILMGFMTRVVFTHTLSEDYVGVNGLFTDILNVLALSELGIGTAITYALYKPIVEGDIEKQKALMRMYRSFYRIVALFVLIVGLLVIPFMDVLIKNQPQVEHLVFLYLMYLANSVISYLLIYKRTLIDAYQLSYIGVLYQTFFLIVQNIIQIIVLLTTRNFVLFISILIGCTICNNISISRKADKMYPFLKDKDVKPLPKEEKQDIYQNIKAMLMHKVGNVVVTNTDNLLISSLVGIISVGIYSNYFLVIGSIRQVLNQAFQGITASVGNLGVEESKERIKRIFDASFFIGQWLFGFAAICLYELLTPFVEMSFGPQYVFDKWITLVLCINFYLTGMRQATLVFRDSLGLFWFDRYKSLLEAIINLVVSLILGYHYGVIGIFLGTMISTITTSLWVEPYMLFKHRLQAPVRFYFMKYVWYVIVTGIAWVITDNVCGLVVGGPLLQCCLRLLICLLIPNVLFLLVYCKTKDFVFVYRKAWAIVRKYMSRRKIEGENTVSPFAKEEVLLLSLVKNSLAEQQGKYNMDIASITAEEWERIISIADKHSVLSLLSERMEDCENLPANCRTLMMNATKQTVLQQYHLLFLSKYLVNMFEENGISTVLLKGVVAGAYYPKFELRKSGDIDLLLLNPSQADRVKQVMLSSGFVLKEEQLALHHMTFAGERGIDIEVHTMLAEPFDNHKINKYMEELLQEGICQVTNREIIGIEFRVLTKAYFGLELLLHMLQHLLRSGFGLKLLCDWVVFWNEDTNNAEQVKYLEFVEKFGIKEFSDVVTETCIAYLGLEESNVSWMKCSKDLPVNEFLKEVLEAEEFGKSHEHRMVMLRGTGVVDYIREFHHQMHLNFPRSGKCFLLWPILWCITLYRFLRNNTRFRSVSTGDILKEAKRRSELMNKLNIFK